MTGLWVIQPIIIFSVSGTLESFIHSDNIVLLVAKLVASVASLVWNYLFYSRLVFKKKVEEEE
jgi:putative flippase GtrA